MSVELVVVSGSACVQCVGLHIAIGDRREYGMMLSVLQLAPLSPFSSPSPE